MDELSAEMYLNPEVIVQDYASYEDRVQAKCQIIFGRHFDLTDFVAFIGAPNRSELVIDRLPEDGDLDLHLSYTWFNGTHDYTVFTENGRRIVRIENAMSQSDAPAGVETRIFAKQIESFRDYGIDEVRLFADGYPNHPAGIVGYYVWARFGFSMEIIGSARRLIEAGMQPCDNTLDLMIQPGGGEWWYNNGSACEAYFYLSEGSACLAALQAYLIEKGVDLNAD
jgi:hypothetical protein